MPIETGPGSSLRTEIGGGRAKLGEREQWGSAWIGICGALAVALPWYVLVEMREPGAWRAFFSNGGAAVDEIWWTWGAGLLPWPLLLFATGKRGLGGLARRLREDARARFLLAAAVLPPIAATVLRPREALWILPALPPAAIVLALGIRAGLTGAVKFRLRLALFGAVPLGIVVLVVVMAVWRPGSFEPWIGLASALALSLLTLTTPQRSQ